MRLLIVLACALFFGCTISVVPIKPAKYTVQHSVQKRPRPIKSVKVERGVLVDSEWMERYKKYEADHGNYTIEADEDIKPEGPDRFRVPRAVIQHHADLIQAGP